MVLMALDPARLLAAFGLYSTLATPGDLLFATERAHHHGQFVVPWTVALERGRRRYRDLRAGLCVPLPDGLSGYRFGDPRASARRLLAWLDEGRGRQEVDARLIAALIIQGGTIEEYLAKSGGDTA